MQETTHHACKMPRRRSKWRHQIYVCKCGTGWLAKHHSSQAIEMPGFYLWYQVELTVSEEATYNHG